MEEKIIFGGVPEHFNIPIYYGLNQHNLHPIQAEWKAYPGGTGAMLKAFADNELQIATLLTEGAVAGILNGTPAQILKFYVDSPLIWGIHTKAGAGIEFPHIQNKKIAISRLLSGSHLIPKVLAKQLGYTISEDDFVIVKDLNGAREALANGSADLFFWEKYITMPFVHNGEFERIGEVPTPWPSFCIVAHNDFISKIGYENLRQYFLSIHKQTEAMINSGNLVNTIASEFGLTHFDAVRWYAEVEWNTKLGVDTEILKMALKRLQQIDLVPDEKSDLLIQKLVYPDAVKETNYQLPK